MQESEEAHSRTLEELQCKDRVIQELGSKLKQQDRSNGTEQNVEVYILIYYTRQCFYCQ